MKITFDTSEINEGIIKCTINNTYTGIAKCHEDDLDMFSELTGKTIARYKALFKMKKAALTKKKQEITIIENFIKNIKFRNPDWIESYMTTLKNQVEILEKTYELAKKDYRDYVNGKDKFYNSVRKMRTQRDNRNN